MAERPGLSSCLIDAGGRLVAADAPIARLQEEAGSRVGAPMAVPQLAALAWLTRKLGVTVSRQALAGTRAADVELWVRADPEDEGVRLTVERWTERPLVPPRWGDRAPPAFEETGQWLELDAELKVAALAPALARRLGCSAGEAEGAPITRLFRLEVDKGEELPLLAAVAARRSFSGQRARLGSGDGVELAGEPVTAPDASFAGYRIEVHAEGGDAPPESAGPAFDELLRDPLDTIITKAQQIARRSDGPLRSDYAAYASDIAAAGQHLLGVLGAMGGDTPDAQGIVDLAGLAADAIALVQPQASERGVRLRQGGPAQLPARGQARAVTQILVNLIGNAARYSPDHGEVQVTVAANGMASVTVADDGPGVANTDRERIFERFEQAEPRGEGAGLGLAISRRLARSLEGDISLDSQEGEGARFTLSLPLAGLP